MQFERKTVLSLGRLNCKEELDALFNEVKINKKFQLKSSPLISESLETEIRKSDSIFFYICGWNI